MFFFIFSSSDSFDLSALTDSQSVVVTLVMVRETV